MNIAYITLATNERYLEGAYLQYKSYLKYNHKYPFYCLVWKTTNLEGYKDLPIKFIPKILPTNNRFSYQSPPVGMFSKICLWLLKEFDYVLFLDSDIIFYQNIDNLIDTYLQAKNNEIIMPMVSNPTNAHDIFSTAWIFMKPNQNTFKKAAEYLNISCNDEEVFTYMYDNKDIEVNTDKNLPNVFDYVFHFNNWYVNQKYWENNLGKKIYELIWNNPTIIPIVKEIQILIAIQPYEFMREDKDDNPVRWYYKEPS